MSQAELGLRALPRPSATRLLPAVTLQLNRRPVGGASVSKLSPDSQLWVT